MTSFDLLRPHLETYLRSQGINPDRRFRCLNPAHPDRHPSMSYDPNRHKVHCFACGADYDLFDLLTLEEHLSSPGEALRRAKELFEPERRVIPERVPALVTGCPRGNQTDDEEYLALCTAHRDETEYFTQRGLSQTTTDRFSLGYDPAAACVVLPCDGGQYIRRATTEKRYFNQKGQPSPLFQAHLLLEDEPVFLVEGTFDALSAEELGYRGVAMNGAGNREKIANLLRQRKKPGPILLIPDRDPVGEQWVQALLDAFPWLYRCSPVPYGKDLNESLLEQREATGDYLAEQVHQALAALPPPYQETTALDALPDLLEQIMAVKGRRRLTTGFSSLDLYLDTGLYEGLYIVGSVSSLGKTAFCMQIADHLARQGQDVLVFTLEMSSYELMARSISRETFLLDDTPGKKCSRTVRDILDGRRWERYTPQEEAHIRQAMDRYGSYAQHLYLREGDQETSLEEILRAFETHIVETGNTPVLLIDYLQIIAPVDVHFSDKQNTDRIVCALKRLSRKHHATVIAISSFNRENYNTRVSMASFKESGGIDYSADVLLGLQARGAGERGFDLEKEKRKDPRELDVIILKNRTAALCKPLSFRYYPAYSYFDNY